MYSIRSRFLLRLNLFLGAAVSVLTGCGTKKSAASSAEDQIMAMYGIPVATYRVSGTVRDAQRKPVSGAQVVVKGYKNLPVDTLTADAKGRYSATLEGWPNETLNFVATDPATAQSDSVQKTVEWEASQGFSSTAKPIRSDIRIRK